MNIFRLAQAIVDQAYDTAKEYHRDQTRKYLKIPYILHPIDVVAILKYWGVNKDEYLAVAYMHDLLEDTKITENEIEKLYGNSVLRNIKELSFDKSQGRTKDEWLKSIADKAEDYIVIIKMADRIANVVDFIRSKHYEKAKTYWKSADPLVQRINRITDVDNNIISKIQDSIKDIENEFGKQAIIDFVIKNSSISSLIERRDYGVGGMDTIERNALELKKKKIKLPEDVRKRINI